MNKTKACDASQSIFIQFSFLSLYTLILLLSTIIYFFLSRVVLRLPESSLTTPRSEYGRRCYPVRANKRWRTWGGLEGGGGGGEVADESRPLYLLLFFSWRLNGSRFLIEKHVVNARRGRFYARKTGPRLLARASMQNLHEICRANDGERFTVL